MKRSLLWVAVIMLFSSFRPHPDPVPASPAAGVYLFVDGITTGCGVDFGHPDEVALSSVQNGFSIPIQMPGGFPTGGAATLTDVVVSKVFDKSSLRIQHYALNDQGNKNFEIRYYDGISPTNVYKIVLETVIVTSAAGSNADCGSGCPGIAESYSFNFIKISWHNFKTIPAQVLTYDVITHTATFVQ
jgi:type VI protein secretion system component Hcp